jgi:hypothetical protein
MSPPGVWGPPIWRFFHILAENIHEEDYNRLIPQLFILIRRTCVYLPCPDCSEHATKFLAKISPKDIPNKTEFKNMLYLFHNMVNKRKQYPPFKYDNLKYYETRNVIQTYNIFSRNFTTRGNMNLINESFHRNMMLASLRSWMMGNISHFDL